MKQHTLVYHLLVERAISYKAQRK
ncbi:hypothetical protein JL09_g6242 [Pichia kudriavzevii]|uniref:Uncharacterized protein n=1 Tax=Pichia kudriavzevii TaxID=4909 RepID=A0A099NPZ7_PICKU|nr:hypothetical protein JL09_g6242 [Pichia kudriavzevii]